MTKKIALVSDFDGTISDNDFFYYLAEKYFDQAMLEPWNQYLSGQKKHFEALNEMFSQLHISPEELKKFISGIKIDKTFYSVLKFCKNENIPVYICSAGCDYYIKELLRDNIEKYNLHIVSNNGTYSPVCGLQMSPNKEFFDENLGVSKTNLIKHLKENRFFVVFCGDGRPDVGPALLADKVFARKTLYQECLNKKIAVELLQNFNQVKNFLEENIK
ncbi:MAG: MtnX-like HAD-IB family phosphatase [Alphaproteobacteria bacterium]|nr:MtnX-like HAD-IB family phosphatase [Alphaproteobacteria bacterium]